VNEEIKFLKLVRY